MRYGFFDDARREYVITRPDTPLPWINYLGSRDFFGLISNTAGGYAFYRDARLRRLMRYRYNNAPLDLGGRYLYLRDRATGHFWSPTWQPTRHALEDYSCRHGLGYTVIASTFQNVRAEILYFVPLDENLEVWQLSLTNARQEPVHLSVFSCVEFCLWDAQEDATNFQRNWNTAEMEVAGSVIYHKTEYRERRNHFAYFACSEPLAGFDTQREAFLGAYRGWDRPIVVERGESCNSIASGWQPIGSHHVQLTLAPGETRQVTFLLGYHENPPHAKFDPPGSQTLDKRTVEPIITRYSDCKNVEEAFAALCAYWQALLSNLQVETPDVHANRMINIWNAYQCMTTLNLARSASYFESGIGRGIGFRDSNQDLLGAVHMAPERARARLLDLAATQMENGAAYHQYQPLTKRGNDDIGSHFNDDPLWLVLAVAAYVKETGDWSILDVPVPFDNAPGTEQLLYEHLQRSLGYTLDRLGPHGLPLIGRADWNDCLNLNCFSETPGESFQSVTNKDGQIAESVMIAGLFIVAAQELAAIARRRGQMLQEEAYRAAARRIQAAVERDGWDGEWFLRAYDDAGRKVGSHTCDEGRIFVEPQGWCIMAGIGVEDGRAGQALAAVREYLATPHGLLLLQPAYSRYYVHLGEISSYPPGYKENAGVFCHTNPWIMIAEAILGHGDQAHDYYARINPSRREEMSDLHRCEPYVYAQMIAGRDAPSYGEAKNSWLTGTAAWNYVAITQWILGIRPTLDGLAMDPCIPSAWDGFKVTRAFRSAVYEIAIENPDHICRGVRAIELDGEPVQGNVLPILNGGTHRVRVVMGA